MPALILFHRRTIFGGDDLQPTSIITIVVRVVQISLLCIPILHYTISHFIQIVQQQHQDSDERYNENDYTSWMNLAFDRLLFTIIKLNTTSTFTAASDEMLHPVVFNVTNVSRPVTLKVDRNMEQLSRCMMNIANGRNIY